MKINTIDHDNDVQSDLNARIMGFEDFAIVRGWCIKENWNLGLHDASIYLQTDKKGHFLFFNKETPIGSISLVKYNADFFTIGSFIVNAKYRGKGYGNIIWNRTIARLNNYPNASILLYAVTEQVDRYKNYGLKLQYKNFRWNLRKQTKKYINPNIECILLTPELVYKISEYDKTIFTASREIAIKETLNYPFARGFYVQSENQIIGYGLIRPCINGYRIGPLFANTKEIAKCILAALLDQTGSENTIIDSPDINTDCEKLMTEFNAKRDDKHDTIVMVKGELSPEYKRNIEKNYGIFSLEIG